MSRIAFLFILIIAASCQQEVSEISLPEPGEVLEKESNLTGLMQSLTARDGSSDNIIDQSSCVAIKLPFRVIVNGEEIVIETEDDYVEVEKILDSYDDDDDSIDIQFPITVVFPDHSELEVTSPDQLEEIIDSCEREIEDFDIECIDIKYPVSVSIYNTNNQVAEVITISSDAELYQFLDEYDDEDILSINFPITVILFDGTEVLINDNDELEDIIESVEDSCDEDDDNDYDDDDVDNSEFEGVLLSGIWEISYFFLEEDVTDDYSTISFSFYKDESTVATDDSGDEKMGKWDSYGDGGYLELELEFENNPLLTYLDQDWVVIEYTDEIIKLEYLDDTDESEQSYLTFRRIGENDMISPAEEIIETITDGQWKVANYENSQNNETETYNSYSISFLPDGKIEAASDGEVATGDWEVTNESGRVQVKLSFDNEPLQDLNEEWWVIESNESRIELRDSPETDYELLLVFEKI